MLKAFERVRQTQNLAYAAYIKERVGDDVLRARPKIPLWRKLTREKIANKILQIYLKSVSRLVPNSIRSEVFITTSIGERHKFMYDRHSLARLVLRCGFRAVRFCRHSESQIAGFSSFCLDTNADGSPYKGCSSLYLECQK